MEIDRERIALLEHRNSNNNFQLKSKFNEITTKLNEFFFGDSVFFISKLINHLN